MALGFVVRNFDYLLYRLHLNYLHYHHTFPQVCDLQSVIFQIMVDKIFTVDMHIGPVPTFFNVLIL